MNKLRWVIGFFTYIFFVSLIPGAIWWFVGAMVDLAGMFMDLPWSIKIVIYVGVALCLQSLWPMKFYEDSVKK